MIETSDCFSQECEFYILHKFIFSVNVKIQSFTEMTILVSDLRIFVCSPTQPNPFSHEVFFISFHTTNI